LEERINELEDNILDIERFLIRKTRGVYIRDKKRPP
jgi:hypothetical protein